MSAREKRSAAVTALCSGLIDYAGLYPPAALGLPQALSNYRSYTSAPDSWMLSRFIAGAAHALQLTDELLAGFMSQGALEISLVSKDPIQELPKVIAALPQVARVVAVESPLVAGTEIKDQLASHREAFKALVDQGHQLEMFYEVPFSENWDQEFLRLVDGIVTIGAGHPARSVGCKLRCGGLEPQLVPSPERLGRALHACAERSIAVKFTAGLHQPFRHMPKPGETGSAGVPMHGYFNLYWAALVVNAKRCSAGEVIEIVAEMESCNPRVMDDSIEWLGVRLSEQEIRDMRSSKVLSFGSCSFEEPIDAARQLGWL
jgi:hypothetical protein